MTTVIEHIKELLIFYVKTNYENYLTEHNIKLIETEKIKEIVTSIYQSRKQHSKQFVKESLQKILTKEYPGDKQVDLLLRDIYEDEIVIIKKLVDQIILYQKQSKS